MILERLRSYFDENTDKFAARWLCLRNPTLWAEVEQLTMFLPNDAKPKQRCWHVLHERWTIPRCPVTDEPVRWFDNRYLTYSSLSAKGRCPKVQKKSLETYKLRSGNSSHWAGTPAHKKTIQLSLANRKATTGSSYRPFTRSETWHEKIQKTWDEKLETQNLDRSELSNYRRQVNRHTLRSYRNHFDKVSPDGVVRSRANHIDHIYSVFDAWKNNVPPEIVSHWTNLRMMPGRKNIQKYTSSEKTLDQLYEDIERSKSN